MFERREISQFRAALLIIMRQQTKQALALIMQLTRAERKELIESARLSTKALEISEADIDEIRSSYFPLDNVESIRAADLMFYRDALDLTQQELADALGIHRTALSLIENDKRSLSLNLKLVFYNLATNK